MNTFPERYLDERIVSSTKSKGIQLIKTSGDKLPVNGKEITISNPESPLKRYLFCLFNGMVQK